MSKLLPARTPPRKRKNLLLERIMAAIATANLGLVLFDLSYVPWRNFWLQGTVQIPFTTAVVKVPMPPQITAWYDPIKGIEPNRETQTYLEAVDRLKQQIEQSGVGALNTPEISATLQELQQLSAEMIATNPFEAAGKSGTLEKIKNLMRDRLREELETLPSAVIENPLQAGQSNSSITPLGNSEASARSSPRPDARRQPLRKLSATAAFRVFWSPVHLTPESWRREMDWFDSTIRPLLATNYYRSIAENGAFTNSFWVIDAPFVVLFLLEFLARTFYISRSHTGVSWLGAMTWRWYDIPLFFPFGVLFPSWAWVRVVSVAIRLDQAELVDLQRLKEQAIQGFVGSIANELTEVVVVNVIDQVQAAVRRGEVSRWIVQAASQRRVEINNVDEVAEISNLFIKLTIYQVFPKIQPDLEALLNHTIETVLKQAPAYQALQTLPGVDGVQTQLTERLSKEVVQAIHNILTGALEDPVGAELSSRLVQHLGQALGSEVQKQKVLQELQSLLNDLLEELKLSYVQRAPEMNSDALLEETRQLRQIARRT